MTTDKQIEWIRKFMIAYNGNAPEWEAIHVFEDPGGLGMSIADFLVKDWEDEDGIMHKGVIDMTYENSAVTRQINPGAKEGVLQLLNARKYKELMYEATMDLLPRNLIEFPAPLHSNHKLQIDGKVIYLSKEEVRALTELDMLKNEICTMRKKQNKVGYSYELEPTMRNRMHDDRAYVLAAACYYLAQLRHEEELKYARPALDMSVLYKNKGKGGFCSGGGDGLDKPAY